MIHFGTGGGRAVIGDGFTKANVQLLTLALARKMLDEGCLLYTSPPGRSRG